MVHSVLPGALSAEVDAALVAAGVAHVQHPDDDPVAAGEAAAADPQAVALIGPVRSRSVAETVAATAPVGLPLIAPMATWAGVTREDEPGCEDDPARHGGTVFRLLARDTEVASRIAVDLRRSSGRALVVAGEHEYGAQLNGQLEVMRLPRTTHSDEADLVVLCGLADHPEIERVRSLAPLPVIAFDGVQGVDLGAGRDVQLALPFAPIDDLAPAALFAGVGQARRAAELVVDRLSSGAHDRHSLLAGLRALHAFDEEGDLLRADVWLWRADSDWNLSPARPLPSPE